MATHVPFITADTMQPCVFTCQNIHSASMCEWRSLQHRLTDQSAADAIWFLKKQSLNFIIKKVRSFHILKTNLSHLGTARHQGDELVLFFHLEKAIKHLGKEEGAFRCADRSEEKPSAAWGMAVDPEPRTPRDPVCFHTKAKRQNLPPPVLPDWLTNFFFTCPHVNSR